MVQPCSPPVVRLSRHRPAAQLLLLLLAAVLLLCCRCCGAAGDQHHQQQPWWHPATTVTAALGRRLARAARRPCEGSACRRTATWWSPRRHHLLAAAADDSSSKVLQLNSTNNSTNSTANGTDAVQPKPLSGGGPSNPWYDQHLLLTTSAGGWGSGLLYGSTSSSSAAAAKVALEADDAAAARSAEQAAMPDPPAYEYPPVLRYPTVFFTAVMHGRTTGLSTEEEAALSAAINAFLAPTPGAITTNTSVLAQAAADSGLWVPAATAFLTADASALQFLAGTLQSDPNLVLPTGVWGALRTANVRAVQPSVADSVRHAWSVGEFSNCSALCGGGSQTRSVTCLDSFGSAADASMCGGAAPPSARACQTQPCQGSLPSDFALVLGQWGPCNSTCSYGSRTRSATCVSKEGYVGSLGSCNVTLEDLAQQLWQPCALPPCPTFVWAYSDWVCSNHDGCGGGTATRSATCTLAATRQPVTSLRGDLCDEAQLDNSTQPCAQSPCLVYYWHARELADCLPEDATQPCGRYLQRRGFDCVNITTAEAVPNINCNGPKPVLGEVECTRPPGVDCSQGNGAALAAAEAAAAAVVAPPAPVTDSNGSTSGDGGPTQVQLAAPDTPAVASLGATSSDTANASSSSTPSGSSAAGSIAAAEAPGSTDASANSTSSNGASAAGSSAGSNAPGPASSSGGGVPQDSSSSDGASGLGPGASLPAWLLDKPTPTLQALLDCPPGLAMSADGRCCNGSFIDAKGSCCEDGGVDACGVCGGTGKAIDALGACCSGLLDAQGVCCEGPLDECGVCNGTNACDLKADLVVAVSPAVLYLVPASNANRRLKAALQDDVAAALAAVTGRPVEKARLGVVLSAYSPAAPGGSSSGTAQHGVIAAVEASEEQLAVPGGNGTTASDGAGSSSGSSRGSGSPVPPGNPSSTPPVAALPAMGGGSSSSPDSMPMQADALITQAPQQLDAPTTHANLAPQPAPTAEPPPPPSSAVLRRLRSLAAGALDAALQQLGGRQVLQEGAYAGDALAGLSASNALVVSITLRAPAVGSGADTGSTLLALRGLEGRQLAVPGARSKLTYSRLESVVRAGTCGDGVCQVNERLSWNNPDSCQADCALPFLSCPPFEPGLPACNGLGVCYNSLGSCACTRGYAGPDCSRCAAGFKRVGAFCVAAAALAPARTCVGAACSGNVTTGLPLVSVAPRSLVGGQAAVATVVLATMALVAGAALYVHRARWRRLLADHEAAVIKEAGTYVAG